MASSEGLHGKGWLISLPRRTASTLLAINLALPGSAVMAAECADSVYTSVGTTACKPVAGLDAGRKIVSGQGDFAFECAAPPGFRLFLITDDARSWYALEIKRRMHSLEHAIAYDNSPGDFPNVGKSEEIEWRLENALTVGLIFRVWYQSADARRSFSRLFAIDLRDDVPKKLGVTSSNEIARAMIDRCSD
jgi:hypothetical protein